MEERHYEKVAMTYDREIKRLFDAGNAVQQEKKERLAQLRAECIQEHGSHTPDGGLTQFCVRCGAYLGDMRNQLNEKGEKKDASTTD